MSYLFHIYYLSFHSDLRFACTRNLRSGSVSGTTFFDTRFARVKSCHQNKLLSFINCSIIILLKAAENGPPVGLCQAGTEPRLAKAMARARDLLTIMDINRKRGLL